jgi:Na+-driven multidrug efflux pump
VAGTWILGLAVLGLKSSIIGIYNVTDEARININTILTIFAFTFWIKVTNFNLNVGVFRSGGDTRFAMALDAGSSWLVGVPLALLGAFVFKLPVYGVYLMIVSEEVIKMVIAIYRFISKKWINDVTGRLVELDLEEKPVS